MLLRHPEALVDAALHLRQPRFEAVARVLPLEDALAVPRPEVFRTVAPAQRSVEQRLNFDRGAVARRGRGALGRVVALVHPRARVALAPAKDEAGARANAGD